MKAPTIQPMAYRGAMTLLFAGWAIWFIPPFYSVFRFDTEHNSQTDHKAVVASRITAGTDRLYIADKRSDLADELSAIGDGVLFVYATWSGPASASLQSFWNVAAKVPQARFPIHVINTDDYDAPTYISALGDLPQGKGEAYWIKGGKIVHRDRGYTDVKRLQMLPLRVSEFVPLKNDHW
jgi:hypothetical protein